MKKNFFSKSFLWYDTLSRAWCSLCHLLLYSLFLASKMGKNCKFRHFWPFSRKIPGKFGHWDISATFYKCPTLLRYVTDVCWKMPGKIFCWSWATSRLYSSPWNLSKTPLFCSFLTIFYTSAVCMLKLGNFNFFWIS